MMKISKITDLPKECTDEIVLEIPRIFRRGSLGDHERKSISSALTNFRGIAKRTGINDWSKLDILDYGCGVKFTQALCQYNLQVNSYTGMDVYDGLIKCLNELETPSNFHFHTVPFHNEMYNKDGIKMDKNSVLPGSIKHFDLICLQSVFTHFEPNDFQALLHVLKNHVKPDGVMIFSCFIDNEMELDFRDEDPTRPLLRAFYKEQFIRDMLKEAKWEVKSLNPRSFQMNAHFVCSPKIA